MTLSRSNTPLNEKRELQESVQELDNLLEDLKNAQVTDEKSYSQRQSQQTQFYSSTSSLNVPGSSAARSSRPNSAASNVALQKLASSSAQEQLTARELDSCTNRLESELNKNPDSMPRGVFVKDVVEEEILVDHVLIQPKQQQSDKRFITRPSDRRQVGERTKRQVAFSEHHLQPEDDS